MWPSLIRGHHASSSLRRGRQNPAPRSHLPQRPAVLPPVMTFTNLVPVRVAQSSRRGPYAQRRARVGQEVFGEIQSAFRALLVPCRDKSFRHHERIDRGPFVSGRPPWWWEAAQSILTPPYGLEIDHGTGWQDAWPKSPASVGHVGDAAGHDQAAKLRPGSWPGITTTSRRPSCTSDKPWSPTPLRPPSHGAGVRTAKRSPATPRKIAPPADRPVEHRVAHDHRGRSATGPRVGDGGMMIQLAAGQGPCRRSRWPRPPDEAAASRQRPPRRRSSGRRCR